MRASIGAYQRNSRKCCFASLLGPRSQRCGWGECVKGPRNFLRDLSDKDRLKTSFGCTDKCQTRLRQGRKVKLVSIQQASGTMDCYFSSFFKSSELRRVWAKSRPLCVNEWNFLPGKPFSSLTSTYPALTSSDTASHTDC